jgi:D-arabinose 1-dehydrogenase-like Zn-dependent alcohol dehydrogenase
MRPVVVQSRSARRSSDESLHHAGVPQDRIELSAFPLVFRGRSIYGSPAGTAIDTEDALAFSVLENVRPMIETRPLEQAADAYARMMEGKARFRMVLTMSASRTVPVNDGK